MAKKKRKKARIWGTMGYAKARKIVQKGKGKWKYYGGRRLLVMQDKKHTYIVTR